MDQRSICLFLGRKELSARGAHNELFAVLGVDAIADSTLNKYLWEEHFSVICSEPRDRPPISAIGNALLDVLDNRPFSLIPELARLTCIPTTTVRRQPISSLGFLVKHLH
jgi:hypothetical protein